MKLSQKIFIFFVALFFVAFSFGYNFQSTVHADPISDLNDQIALKEKQKQDTLNKIKAIEAQIASLSKSAKNLSALLADYQQQQKDLNTQVDTLKTQIEEQDKNLEEFSSKLEDKKGEIEREINYLYKLSYTNSTSIFSSNTDIKNYFDSKAELNYSIELNKLSIKNYYDKIDTATKLKEQSKTDLESAENAIKDLDQKIASTKEQIAVQNAALASANKNKAALVSFSNDINNQLSNLSAQQKALLDAELAKMNSAGQANQTPLQPGQYYFTGIGRDLIEGHGLGMSQWGAYGMATKGWTYDKILTFYYTGTNIGTYTEPQKIVVYDKWTGGAGKLSTVLNSNLITGTGVDFNQNLAVSTTLSINYNGAVYNTDVTEIINSSTIKVDKLIPFSASGLSYTNQVSLTTDDYLSGIGEVPNSWPIEAIKAQVVAARTYVMGTCKGKSVCAICSTPSCQVYNGGLGKKAAVIATKGKVVLYNGSPIVAYYSASHRGYSTSLNSAWGSKDLPYIQPVNDDPYAYKDYQSNNPYYNATCNCPQKIKTYSWRWRTNGYTLDQLSDIFSRDSRLNVGKLQTIQVQLDAPKKRVARITLIGSAGSKTLTGWTFRSIFNATTPYNDYVYSTEFGFYQN